MWTELTVSEKDVFDYGVEMSSIPPERMISDGDGHYLNTVLPTLRNMAGLDLTVFSDLLELFWVGWASEDHTWDEEDHSRS